MSPTRRRPAVLATALLALATALFFDKLIFKFQEKCRIKYSQENV